jgi:hypothetical protein
VYIAQRNAPLLASGAFLCTMTTEIRTFVGEVTIGGSDGWVGFYVNKTYQLQVHYRKDGNVGIKMNQPEQANLGLVLLVVTQEQYEKWFRK